MSSFNDIPKAYTGVIHVHTKKSGAGEGTLEEVLTAARKNDVDFVVLTDNNTLGYLHDEEEGWHDEVLILCGEYVSIKEAQFLAFELREEIAGADTLEEALEKIHKQSGVTTALHHLLPTAAEKESSWPAPPLPIEQADLLELWSFMDDFLSSSNARNMMKQISRPEHMLKGPARRLFWMWDRELEKRQIPAIGGLGIQPRKDPLLDWKEVFSYDLSFQTICTCIQVPDLPKIWVRARDLVWNALREGRSFIVNRAVESEKGFHFEYVDEAGKKSFMGSTVSYHANGRFRVSICREGNIVLRHNGQPLYWGTAENIDFPNAGPGSYRVEVYIKRRLWIVSNPIRLSDEDGVMQPTVSDVT